LRRVVRERFSGIARMTFSASSRVNAAIGTFCNGG
jgi:hypothetical protein